MSYPDALSTRMEEILEPILPAIVALKEGAGLNFEGEDVGDLLYALNCWRHINDLKTSYKFAREGVGSLRVIRRAKTFKVTEDKKNNAIAFVHENLLEVLDETEALNTLKVSLPPELVEEALVEWKRING